MEKRFMKNKMTIGAALLLVATCVPVLALAETDRLTVEDPATGAVKFKVTSDGNVSGASLSVQQGASEPASTVKLSVKDSSSADLLAFDLNGFLTITAHFGQLTTKSFDDNAAVRPVYVANRARGTMAGPTVVQLNDKLGTFAFAGYDGTAYQSGALLEAFTDGTVTAGSVPARLSLVTGTGPSNRAERLVVKSTGNIGIGTITPGQKLEVNGGIRINTATAKPACDTTTRGTFWVTQNATNDLVEVCAMVSGALVWKGL